MAANLLSFENFENLDDLTCDDRIRRAKAQLGDSMVILGHHYQRDEVYRHADITGDSLKLSQLATSSQAQHIVFCGVHFMAEVADILSRPDQAAILPDLAAGCAMADMANLRDVERCWQELGTVLEADQRVTPITYINSAADLKAFCGRHEGIVCTSTNAQNVLQWAFERREKVLFFPDQHLGRNTAFKMGIGLDEMVVWDFSLPMGGLTAAQIRKAKVLLWKGYCSVHQMFRPQYIDEFKQRYPESHVIAHPECSFEVCQKADYVGSTEYILNTVKAAPAGSRWLVGTELNLVNRLNQECKKDAKSVHFMSPTVCMCSTMFRTDPQHLVWALENLVEGRVVNQIKVPEQDAASARLALAAMFSVS
jgi:quinolinate synthase